MKTLSNEIWYVLKNTDTEKFAKVRNVGGFDNEKLELYWIKNVDCAYKFANPGEIVRLIDNKKDTDKYQIVKIKRTTNIVNTCCLTFAIESTKE